MKLRRALSVLTALALLPISGCSGTTIFSNYREVEDLELVRTICVDKAGDGVNVLICTSPTGEEAKLRMFERSAESVATGLAKLRKTSTGKEALLSHTENLLIGDAEAARGVGACLDYVVRYGEIMLDTNLFIVRGMEGRELMRGIAGETTSPASVLSGVVMSLPMEGEGYVFTCRDTAVSLSENGCALVMAISGAKEEKLFEDRGDMRVVPAGFALLTDGRLVDYLTEEETLGVLLLRSKLKDMDVDIPCRDGVITVSLSEVETEVVPRLEGDKLAGFRAELSVKADVVNISGSSRIEDKDVRAEAESWLSDLISKSAEAAIRKSQATGADFLELCGIAMRSKPMKLSFTTEEFRELLEELDFQVTVKSTLRRTYDVTDPLDESGEEVPGIWERLILSLKGS